jgi:hypothetical protein
MNQPPATSRNQPAVLFSQNKPAPAISHQPTEQAEGEAWRRKMAWEIMAVVDHCWAVIGFSGKGDPPKITGSFGYRTI